MESSSRFLPLPTYRDPDYDSDSSFENYYLNYAEEQNSGPHPSEHDDNQATDDSETSKESDPHKILCKKRLVINSPPRTGQDQIGAGPDNSPSPQSIITGNTPVQETPGPGRDGLLLFTRRVLQMSDLNKKQRRLSLPCKQVVAQPKSVFLDGELISLEKGEAVEAKLMDPKGIEHEVKVRLTMAGPSSYCYAIGKPWISIVNANGLKPGMEVNLWTDRRGENGRLRLILERV